MKTHPHPQGPLPEPLLSPADTALPCPLPLFAHRVRAGFPSPAEEYLEGTLDLNQYLVRNRSATFFFRVRGLSLKNIGILDNDILAADRSIEPKHRHIVIASIDGEFTVKRLYQRARKVELHAENPDYPAIRPLDGQEVLIWGVVTGVVRKLQV